MLCLRMAGLAAVVGLAGVAVERPQWIVGTAIGTALVTPPDAGSMIMLLGVVGGLYEVGILAAQLFVRHTKPADEETTTEVAKS